MLPQLEMAADGIMPDETISARANDALSVPEGFEAQTARLTQRQRMGTSRIRRS